MNRHLPTLALIVVGLVLAVGLLTQKSDPDRLRFEVSGERAVGYGFTDSRSVGVIDDLLRDHPQVDTLVLADMPGTRDVDMNRRIVRRIRERGLDTHLTADSFIASGAVTLFLAGVERTAECGARIGVHSWGSALGYEPRDAGVRDDQRPRQRKLLAELGIDPDFYDFTVASARAGDLHILSREEMERWGVVTRTQACPQKLNAG